MPWYTGFDTLPSEPAPQETEIPLEDLVDRCIYRLLSRNLVVGVWSAKLRAFTGIREKLGSRYLFTECHWSCGVPFGTAHAYEILGTLPEDISIDETIGIVCGTYGSGGRLETGCAGDVTWKELIEGDTTVVPLHKSDGSPLCEGCHPCAVMNRALFDFLEPFNEAELLRN